MKLLTVDFLITFLGDVTKHTFRWTYLKQKLYLLILESNKIGMESL